MRFKNAVQISIDNFGSVFKLLLYRVITGALFFSLIYVILRLSLASVVESAEVHTLKDLVNEFLRAIANGDSERLQTFQEDFHDALKNFWNMIGNNSASIIWSIVGVACIYLLSRFANGLAVFAVGSTINDRMSIFARTRFSSSYFKSIGKAALYQVIYVPLSFVYDALAVLACWFFFFYAPSFFPNWGILSVFVALALTTTALICLESLKMTLISGWMPAMIADKKGVGAALGSSLKCKKDFGRRFCAFLAASYLILVVNILFALCTFGSALLLTLPLSFIFVLSLQFVNYYKTSGRKYFISYNKIIGGDGVPENLSE